MSEASEDQVFGFSRADADAVLATIKQVGSEPKQLATPPRGGSMLGYTKTGGLAPGAEGSVWIMEPTASGWATTSNSCPAWTVVATIPAASTVLFVEVNGRWVALKIC